MITSKRVSTASQRTRQARMTADEKYIKDCAAKIGKSPQSIRRALARGEGLSDDILDIIGGTCLGTAKEMDALCEMSPAAALELAKRAKGGEKVSALSQVHQALFAPALAEHADAIRELEQRANADVKYAVTHFIEIGNTLIKAKALVGHGRWLPWLEREFVGWTEQMALNRMRLAKFAAANPKIVLDLDLPASALFLLAAPSTPEEVREEILGRAEAGEAVSHGEVKAAIAAAKTIKVQVTHHEVKIPLVGYLGKSKAFPAPPVPSPPVIDMTPEKAYKKHMSNASAARWHEDDLSFWDKVAKASAFHLADLERCHRPLVRDDRRRPARLERR